MARKFKVEGTKAFKLWAIGLLFFGLWCVKDGWFPSEEKIRMHGPPHAPKSHDAFYDFNHTLAYIALSASSICAIIHRIVR